MSAASRIASHALADGARLRGRLAAVAAISAVLAVSGCGGRAAHVSPRVPRHVIGDHSVRPWPDPLVYALERWVAATDRAPEPVGDWGSSDEPGAAELRGVALGTGARARVAARALALMSVAHRALGAPRGDLLALRDLIGAIDSVPDEADPGFSVVGRALALELVAAALATAPADPAEAELRARRLRLILGQPTASTSAPALVAEVGAYAARATELSAGDARIGRRVARAARDAVRAAERWAGGEAASARASAGGAGPSAAEVGEQPSP